MLRCHHTLSVSLNTGQILQTLLICFTDAGTNFKYVRHIYMIDCITYTTLICKTEQIKVKLQQV